MDDRKFAAAMKPGSDAGRHYGAWRRSSIAAAPLVVQVIAVIAAGAVQAASPPDLTGTWELDATRSEDPRLAQKEHESSGGGTGVAKRVMDGISVFGVPVGQLPLPSKAEPEPLEPDDLPGAEQVLSTVTRIRILQEESATEFDYGGAWTAAYTHDGHALDGDRTVSASWHGNDFEVVHHFDDGTRVTETYYVGATGQDLHWVVRLKQKGADEIAIERVFERKSGT
jgi:hypothetical protein